MDFKRALETQRIKLLRLLTGWVVMLGVLSGGPLALPVPRWVRAFFETLVIRAEYATQSLVRVSVCLHTSGGLIEPSRAPFPSRKRMEDVPSARALIRRMNALRDLLENLPREARRLMRVQKTVVPAFDFTAPLRLAVARDRLARPATDWFAPRVERPPDKRDGLVASVFGSPRDASGRWWCFRDQ